MTTLERKKYLKSKIDNIESEEILDKIEKIFEENEEVYILSDEQRLRIEEARAEYLSGKTISDEDDQKYFEEWFREQEK